MGIMKKTIATLLVICMMFSFLPTDMVSLVFEDINVEAGVLGESTDIKPIDGGKGKAGGVVNPDSGAMTYRVCLARDDPKVFLTKDKDIETEFIRSYSYEYPPFSRGAEAVEDTLFFLNWSYIYSAIHVDKATLGTYTNNPASGMEYLTGTSITNLFVPNYTRTSKPSNSFKTEAVRARDAKEINTTADLAKDEKWKTYAEKMSLDEARQIMGYILNEKAGINQRVVDVTDENFNKETANLDENEAFKVSAGYGGLLVALWKIADANGATAVAATYEEAITDYFNNDDLPNNPVTILIDTCMVYTGGVKDYVTFHNITPSVELYEYVIATDADNSILNGPEFMTMNGGSSTTREMIMAMAESSFEKYPFAETKGWITSDTNSATRKVLRLIDREPGDNWGDSLRGTAIGWAIKVFQFETPNSHIWMWEDGPAWASDSIRSGYMDHFEIVSDYTSLKLDGFVAIGNSITNPNPIAQYSVVDDSQTTSDTCDPLVTLNSPAHITLSIGKNADFLSFLDGLKNMEGGGKVKVTSAVKRIETLDGKVIETLEAPFPADDGSVTGTGAAAVVQSAINWEGNIADFIANGVSTIDVFDDSIIGKTYEKKKEGNQTLRFEYDIDLKIFVNEQKWEFDWEDIVAQVNGVPQNTVTFTIQPLDENMGCFTEDVEIIDIPGTYGTDTTQDTVLPSDNEDAEYYTRMLNRYEYTSSVGKSLAAASGENAGNGFTVTGNTDVADGDVAAFAEIKSNTPLNEEWEVMAGIPSSEEIYFSVGGAEYKVAIIVQYWMNEHSRDRTYTIHFDGEKCEYNNEGEGTGDRLKLWYTEAQPTTATASLNYSNNNIHCLNEPGTGAGDWQVQATWTWSGTAHDPEQKATCAGGETEYYTHCDFSEATALYQADLALAQQFQAELAAEIVYWTAASDGEYREYYWDVTLSSTAPVDGTSPGDPGAACAPGHGCSHVCTCEDGCTHSCPSSPCDPGSACTGHTYSITVTGTIPAHAVCGPCCGHNMPDLYDTWRQGLVYDYAKISQIRLYLLDQGSVEGLTDLTGTDRLMANIVSGNPTYFMNIAQVTEHNTPFLPVGTDEGAESVNTHGVTFYGSNSTHSVYDGIYGNFNRYEAQSSRAGRIRYVLDPTYTKSETFDYSEQGDGSGGSFTLSMEDVANPRQHDDVIVEMGPRSANCDGMSNHNEFGKSAGNNVIPDTAYGHAETHEWADGCLYTHIIDDSKTNFSNYHRLSSYGYSYVAQELKANDENVSKYSELYNHHVQRDGLTNKASYSDEADDRDIATAEWKVFNAARRTKVIAVVISDFLIMQTSGGDQSIFYFEKAAESAEAQEHFQKVKATEEEMFTENPLSIFNSQSCEDPCSEIEGSAYIKAGIQGFEIIGGYNGRYDRPADKYKPYSPVTKEFLNFGGTDGNNWSMYNASYNRSNWTEKVGGNYSPHGNYKVYTIFDDDPAGTINRPARQATSQATSFKIIQDNVQILPTAPNQFYQPTNAKIWYSQVAAVFTPDTGVLDMETMSTYVGARSNVNLGWIQRNKYGSAWMTTWGNSVGLELGTKYYLTEDGDSNTDSINGVLVYTPVSVEDALVLPQGDLSINGYTISRDQRVNDWEYPDMNEIVNSLKVCTLDPATCEYRYLDCKYLHETVLADFDFSATYQGTEPDYSGDYEHNLKPTTKKNTYYEDGRWITTNKITGVEYILPEGYTIKSSGFGTGNYLSATGSTAWSIPFSDLGLSNIKTNRVKITMDLKVNATSGNTMVVGFKNVGFIINSSGTGQYIRPYDENPKQIGSTKSFTTNMKNVKLELIFGFNNIVDCEAYVNGVAATVNTVTDYRYDWETTTNAQGFETRQKVLKYVTIPEKEWLTNPPENFTTGDIMGTLNIGTWGNTNSTYNANFYLDNLQITLMGGTTEHTSACYERRTVHTSTKIHVCDENCYLKEDVYTCDGEPNANYQCNGVKNKHEHTNACYTNVTTSSVTVPEDNSLTKEYVAKTAGTIVLSGYGSCSVEHWVATLTVNGVVKYNYSASSPGYYSYSYNKDDVVKFYVYSYNSCSIGWTVSWTNGSFGELTGNCTGALNTHVHTGTAAGLDYANGCYSVPTEHKHNNKALTCAIPVGGDGSVYNISYKASIQSLDLPAGVYQLEVWGASGGQSPHGTGGGAGGYGKGTYTMTSPDTLYIVTGGQGYETSGGYNGGGPSAASSDSAYGGGATHIATASGLLSSLSNNKSAVLIVAGGGGAAGCSGYGGGAGGGANQNGGAGTGSGSYGATGPGGTTTGVGTQMSGTISAGFGYGGYSNSLYNSGGGGGGYYGGQAGNNVSGGGASGGGGSGYAKSVLTNVSGTSGTNTGNGYAKITTLDHQHTDSCYQITTCDKMPAGTYVCTGIKNTVSDLNAHKHTVECLTDYVELDPVTFQYTGGVQTFKVPYTDYYKVEVYGPGANSKAGYVSATVKLNQDDLLYLYVGGTGGYHNYTSDIRFMKYTDIPAGLDPVEIDVLEKNNAASDATILLKAGRTSDTIAANSLTGYELSSITKSMKGNSTNGRIIFTPLNRWPQGVADETILEQILNGDIPEEEVSKYLGDELAQTIIDTAQVFKTYEKFSWTDYQGVTKASNNVTFANNSIISNVVTQNAYEFYIPVSISAKTLRQIRITLDNNTSANRIGVAINGGTNQIYAPMSANTKNQVITINVSDTWWNSNITSLYFNTAVGTPTGTTAVKKIELIGHANVTQDESGYGYTNLKTISGFSTSDTKGFANLANTTISYSGSNMVVTSTGENPRTRWNTIGSIDAAAVKAIKLVFTNKSATATSGKLYYNTTAANSWTETDVFNWYVGGSGVGKQTVWIDTVNHTSYNQTTNTFTQLGSGWTGTIKGMRFDWSELTSGAVEVESITFIGNGTATGTGGYSYQETVVAGTGNVWTYSTVGSQSVTFNKGNYKVEVYGAQGGSTSYFAGGLGGYSYGNLNLTADTVLNIYVGGQNGTNGGGTGGTRGGGASDIRIGGTALSNRVIVAGGGGGAGLLSGAAGGAGGGGNSSGAAGGASNWASGGTGASVSAGGSGGAGYSNEAVGSAGTLGTGGAGGTTNTTGGGGGGGYYGGGGGGSDIAGSYGSVGSGAGGGGSGYVNTSKFTSIGGSNGQRSGNGLVRITALENIYDSVLTADKVTITTKTYSPKVFTAFYRNPLQNETARQTIYDNLELIPDYVDGIYNPIWVCKFEGFNYHDCKNCNTYIELDCNEPHHKGLTYDKNGNLVLDNYGNPLCKEHYAGANKICWSACCDDDNHKNTKDSVIVDDGNGGSETLRLAEFLQLDEGFTIYFPNIGDFYGNGALGLANPQITRGYGYENDMDTTRWTREKRVKFPFDVIFEEIDGTMNIYPANTWIELDVPTVYFNFYLLVENAEMANASVEFECEAINCGTNVGTKQKAGLRYSSMIDTAYGDALDNFLKNYLNEWYADISDEGWERPLAKPKGNNYNEGAGKRINISSWGYLDFYVSKQQKEAKALQTTVNNIDKQIEVDFEGSFNDYMINHTGTGMNEKLKPLTFNDNKVRVNNALRSDGLRHLHGAYKHFYLDVIGRIGNFAIVDTEDFRFSNFFKVPIISEDDTEGLNDPNNWLVEGLILQVDDSIQNLYVGDTYDIRGNKAQVNTRWLDTYGTESWMTGTLENGVRNINNPNLKSQILTGEVNNIEILKQEQLRYGYDIYTSIVTFGSYENGQIQVVPKYYALKVTDNDLDNVPSEYNVPKGTYIPLDVYTNEDGSYSPVNIYNNAGNGSANKGNIPMTDYVFNLDWTEESERRNYTLEEVNRTNRVKEYFKTIIYDLTGIEEGAEYDPADRPILEIKEYITPNGKSNYLGTCQYIMMDAKHRTFIGSSDSYDNNPGGDAIWISRAGTTNFGVDKGAYPNAYDPTSVRAIEEIQFEKAVQRWHGKLGLPSSSVFVPHGEKVNADSMEWIQGENEDEWVIVCTAEIIAIGTTWNIYYSQPWFTEMTIYGETYSTGEHYPGHRVVNANDESIPCPQCLPPIIAVFGKTSVEDVEIVQIY